MRMERRIRHGKRMSSYEEAVMDLMARVEESERYLRRYRNIDGTVIVVEDGEEELYPSFSIGIKEHSEDDVQIRNFFTNEKVPEEEEDTEEIEKRTEVITVKLTVWEWMEARRKGIVNVLLLSAAFFLQIYIAWTDMNAISYLILKTMKNACIVALVLKFVRWIISGEMYRFLNEES